MNKSAYMNRKIRELETYEKEITKKQIRNLGRYIMATLPTIALAIALGKYLMLYKAAATVGIMASMLVAGARFDYCSKKNALEEINDEKNHLKTIKTKGINSNKKLDQKRLERINTLQNQQEEINSKGVKTGVACAISGIVSGIGAVGIMFNPLIGGIVSGISLLTAVSLANDDLEGERSYNKLEARINNLKNDIELGSIYGHEINKTQSSGTNNQTEKSPKTTQKKISEPIKKESKQHKITNDQEKQIAEYLAYLSAMKDKEQAKENKKMRK